MGMELTGGSIWCTETSTPSLEADTCKRDAENVLNESRWPIADLHPSGNNSFPFFCTGIIR